MANGYSQTKYGDGNGNGVWRGKPCDDKEYRGHSGLPNWKNYGGWLSECDSIASAWEDSSFAIILEERNKKRLEEKRRKEEEWSDIDIDAELDMDAMWDNTIWKEIEEVTTIVAETEYVTSVAGVRGAEAEDEALNLLYYRRSMRGIAMIDLQKAYGRLKNTRDELIKTNPNHPKLDKINNLISQLKLKIKKA